MKISSAAMWSVASFAVLALLGCGKPKLDPAAAQTIITDALKTRDVTLKSITCPPREIKAGDTFDCEGVTQEGEKVTFKVTQKDDQGNISIAYGHIMNQAKVGEHLAAKIGPGAELKCPSKAIVLKKGATFTCDLKMGAVAGKYDITVKDDEGGLHGKLQPGALAAAGAEAPKVPEVDGVEAD